MTTIFDEIRAKRESPEEAEYRERERQRELRERERIGDAEYEYRRRQHYNRIAAHEREMHNFFWG